MRHRLDGKRIAIMVEDGFEQLELTEPKKALEKAGAQVDIVSPARHKVKGWNSVDWGDKFAVDMPVARAEARIYDGLLLPGGVMSPDKLRINRDALRLVKGFFDAGKPVAAICHGPATLIDAGVVVGRTLTSHRSIAADLKNAGARWIDEETVNDGGLVTSRTPEDLPAFIAVMIEAFASGRASATRAA